MSKKSLLNETQVRQFMKLAKLEPLAPGFVAGLTEAPAADTHGTGFRDEDEADLEETHGRGTLDQNYEGRTKVAEGDEDEELRATEDELGAEDHEADLEGDEIEDLEADLGGEEVGDGRMVDVDSFLSALEDALETALGDEVEIDAEEMDDDDVVPEEDFAPEGEEVVADDELEMELAEGDKDEATDDIVEQITKRVAARILKSALAKKK